MTTMTVSGRLGRDATVNYTTGGKPVARLALAYNYGRKDDQGNRPTQWVDANLWGEQAERLSGYLKKGTALNVVLRDVHVEQWSGDDNLVRSSLRGDVIHLEFAPTNKAETGGAGAAPAKPAAASGGGARPPRPAPPPPSGPAPAGGGEDFDDDIPF